MGQQVAGPLGLGKGAFSAAGRVQRHSLGPDEAVRDCTEQISLRPPLPRRNEMLLDGLGTCPTSHPASEVISSPLHPQRSLGFKPWLLEMRAETWDQAKALFLGLSDLRLTGKIPFLKIQET